MSHGPMTRCLQTLAALAQALSTTSSGASPPAPDQRSERAGPACTPWCRAGR